MILFASHSTLIWLFFIQAWILVLWFGQGSRRRSPFGRRLDQLLVILRPPAETNGSRTIAARTPGAVGAFRRQVASSGLRGLARRWRAQLGAVYAQGYQVALETTSPPAEVAHSGQLVRATLEALKAERSSGGASVPATEDPVVVLAYGLGAWPSGADLTSLEQLLGELCVSHDELRNRFEGLLRTIPAANQNREFRELAGAAFVLGASARIVEAADPPAKSAAPPGWRAAIRAHRR